ncbi:DM9 repeat-containing protein [Nostoc commune]|uniref:DM9 repeat-containing protein n=1 Tax=Nostoc commune TaxID=1178 RepID=UPI0018C7F5A2|nr:DM9 repeat-containing protein [Nostoc commune]MBG1263985.1 DUF3421 domain-containing protein [Nostoc commune BAE]
MNLSNFRIKSTLAGLAILAGTVIPASSTFAENIPIPPNAVFGGYDTDGTALYVCSGIYNNGVHPGKRPSNSDNCYIGYGGYEVFSPSSSSVVLTNPFNVSNRIPKFYWITSSDQQPIPINAVPTGFERGYSLYSCRASYNGGTAIGKLTDLKLCYFGYGGREISANSYDVLGQ